MSLYAPLNNDAPAIPSLDELRTGASPKPVAAPKPAAETKKMVEQQRVMVASYAVVETPIPDAAAPQHKYMVKSCCCFSLPTGVYILALMETVGWCLSLVGAIFAILLETQKGRIDHAIKKGEDADVTEEPQPEDEMSTSEKVHKMNMMIDAGAIASAFLIVMAAVGLYFCAKGFKAAKGDAEAARVFFMWRRVYVFYAAVSMLFGNNGGPIAGIFSVLLAIYYALVVRSHWINLTDAQQEGATTTSEVAVVQNMV